MTGIERPKKRTKPNPAELWDAFAQAWEERFGASPSRETLALLLAHWAFETGHGDSCWNWNLGNEKYPLAVKLGEAGDWQWYPAGECRADGSTYTLVPPHRGACWRAHATLAEGCRAHLSLLERRYQSVWPALLKGDPATFCDELKKNHYFTADLNRYTRGVTGCYRMYWRLPDIRRTEQPKTIRLSSIGETVRKWQEILGIKVDGKFGPVTERLTKLWQRNHGLTDDGIVGPATWAKALT